MSRWQQFFIDEPELALVECSKCSKRATELFRKHNCKTILDLACGAGRESRFFSTSFPFVVSSDYSISGLRMASAKGNTNLICSDARKLPFPNKSFDAVYCYGLLHEFIGNNAPENVRLVMSEIGRILKNNGLLILTVLCGDPVNGDPEIPNVQFFSDEMYFDATTGFECLEYFEYDDISCTGNPYYHIHYGAFVKS
ncbi:MAG: class I SAM-dependent methyltransferase [Fibrobacteres bacterium]|nr:class I SAM-dependent methyltransferase [Fibrobacterota bacterium]